jgi:hypothetical protein
MMNASHFDRKHDVLTANIASHLPANRDFKSDSSNNHNGLNDAAEAISTPKIRRIAGGGFDLPVADCLTPTN